jgi:MFS family permease
MAMATDYHARGPDEWPVHWSAVWVGALTALAVALIIGLIGIAVGAHEVGAAGRLADFHKVSILALVFAIAGAFFANAAGGWVAGKIGGFRRAEPSMLHGGIAWLVAVPLLLILAALGAGSFFGGWYGGLAGTPAWAAQAAASAAPAGNAAQLARNEALATLTALLVGLIGAVIGGWMASGEPMTFTHWRQREAEPEHIAKTRETRVRVTAVGS